jgi:hypothetical protein
MRDTRRLCLAGFALSLLVACSSEPSNVIDLIEEFPQAEQRSNSEPPESAFELGSVTIDGQQKQTILAKPFSRLTYRVEIPDDAWFDVSFALKPEAWDLPGNGAVFRVGVSAGGTYEELLNQYVNPKRGDRRWFSARLDLSAYDGQTVELILNTDPGPPRTGDAENDLAVWAAPRVYSRR